MLHTVHVNWELTDCHVQFARDTHGVNSKEITDFVKGIFESMTVKINESEYTTWMSLIVDVPLLLKKGKIRDRDYQEVENEIKAMLSYAFGDIDIFDEHYLARFDYRLDKKVEGKEIRMLYNDLYKKTCRKTGRLKKLVGKKAVNGEFKKYDTSMYHSNKSVQTILYDKEAERFDKGEKVELWERDVMRFEVRLLKEHLKYRQFRGKNRTPRKIKSYFKLELFNEYVEKYLHNVYIQGDFYSLEKAEHLLHTTKHVYLSPTMKTRMKVFLRKVSKHDLTVPKSEMSPSTFRARLKYLDAMNMHPVTIPQTKTHIASFLPCLFSR